MLCPSSRVVSPLGLLAATSGLLRSFIIITSIEAIDDKLRLDPERFCRGGAQEVVIRRLQARADSVFVRSALVWIEHACQ